MDLIPFGRILPFAIGSRGQEERRTVRRLVFFQAKNKKKAPMATKYRVSRKQCTLSVSAPEDYKSSKFRTAPAGGGGVSVSPGDANISWDRRPLSLALRWCPVCQVQLWVASL